MAGQGFALLTPLLWKGDVAAGRLCLLFPERVSVRGWSYWLVYPKERHMVPKVKRFREWLLAEMRLAVAELDGGWAAQGRVPASAQIAAQEGWGQARVPSGLPPAAPTGEWSADDLG